MNIILLVSLLFSPQLYTEEWIDYSAHILAGETIPGCASCHEVIACTLINDAESRIQNGDTPFTLYPNRWHGWRENNSNYKKVIEKMLIVGCDDYPTCRYLGNGVDYTTVFRYWSDVEPVVYTIDSDNRSIVCVPFKNLPLTNTYKCDIILSDGDIRIE
jgi:hypothetical protein